ncbi:MULTISPECIES: hypothetical protein [Winogradskyella]|uniref:Uncharacterized protein n=1 Tax=Winogradskyella ouciana TaxID=2608631 RepID=A0A7K1G859_9FLAO|nr:MULTISPECIES: hypothetical protein [Winogradskyella]MBO6881279.1 hypothetical protein [Winogradskyella sp.]MTE25472.1 hypothetical protein [Winogradskyella ouciana]
MKYFFFFLFVTSQIFSHAQQQQDYIANWECETSKEELIEKKLYEKKYYGKLIQIKNVVTLDKSFNVYFENFDNDSIVNFHINIDHTIEGNITNKKVKSFYSNSMKEVYEILTDLQQVIYNKDDECYFSLYYFEIDYIDEINEKVYRYLYWLEKKQLENFLLNKNKKKLYQILKVQTDE